MGSHKKRKNSQIKPSQLYQPAQQTGLLTITVAVSPSSEMSLVREVQMVKAALLYADKVTLCSPGVSTVLASRDPQHMNEQQRNQLLLQIAPLLGFPNRNMDRFKMLLKASKKPGARFGPQGALLSDFQNKIDQTWVKIAEQAEEQIKEYGVAPLLPVIQSGLVTLQPLPVTILDIITAAANRQLS